MRKQCARELCTTVNNTKLEIADIKKLLDEPTKQSAHVEFGDEVYDEQKYHLMQRFRTARSAYQRGFRELKEVKTDLELLQQEVRDCKQKLLESFYRWFETKTMFNKGDLQSPARSAAQTPGEMYKKDAQKNNLISLDGPS